MLAVFRVMVERTLWLRGMLRDADVTGGVPADARPKIAENGKSRLSPAPQSTKRS
jgi:hypothetical protein